MSTAAPPRLRSACSQPCAAPDHFFLGEVSVESGQRDAVTLPPFDAWAVVEGEPEPMGSHPSVAAALARLDATGGAVTAGLTFLRWHPATADESRAALMAALTPHGIRWPGAAA